MFITIIQTELQSKQLVDWWGNVDRPKLFNKNFVYC